MALGLLYTLSTITEPRLTSTTYNTWYTTTHIPELLSIPGGPTQAHRYKATNTSQKCQFLALYPLNDIAFTRSPEIAMRVSSYHPVLPDERSIWELRYGREGLFAFRQTWGKWNEEMEYGKARWIVTLDTDARELPKDILHPGNRDLDMRYMQYSIHRAPTAMAGVNGPQFHIPGELMILELDREQDVEIVIASLHERSQGYRVQLSVWESI